MSLISKMFAPDGILGMDSLFYLWLANCYFASHT